jgi:peptidoglycan/xylan/chitin deacetylase (PgdA/CDA1 family)
MPPATGADRLVGYGGRWPDLRWPNGSRLAVSLVINFEEGAQRSVSDGDEHNENLGDLPSGVPAGMRDIAIEQMFAYGTRAGFWRILDGLERHGVNATWLICGRAAERFPELVRAAVSRGDEPASHGYRWVNHALMTDAAIEEAEIRRASAAIMSACGISPVGFYARWGPSLHTRNILRELGFLYDSNAYDDDLPYWDSAEGVRPILVLPYALDSNDWRFIEGDPWGSASQWLDYLNGALEILRREAARGQTRMFTLGLHLRIAGRPGRFWGVECFLEHLASLGDEIWVATRAEIATHWAACLPPPRPPGS